MAITKDDKRTEIPVVLAEDMIIQGKGAQMAGSEHTLKRGEAMPLINRGRAVDGDDKEAVKELKAKLEAKKQATAQKRVDPATFSKKEEELAKREAAVSEK